jgi:hypothetical protein
MPAKPCQHPGSFDLEHERSTAIHKTGNRKRVIQLQGISPIKKNTIARKHFKKSTLRF